MRSSEASQCWLVTQDIETKACERALTLLSCWANQPLCRVIVRGFPTARRHEYCPGIEIPNRLFQHIYNTTTISERAAAGASLGESSGTLHLVKRQGELHVWHTFQSRFSAACSCRNSLSGHGSCGKLETPVGSYSDHSRHILGDCASTHLWLDHRRHLMRAVAPPRTDLHGNGLAGAETTFNDAASTTNSAICCIMEDISTVATDSLETSVDSDMLSISDTSGFDWIRFAEQWGGLSDVIASVSHRLYDDYRNTRGGVCDAPRDSPEDHGWVHGASSGHRLAASSSGDGGGGQVGRDKALGDKGQGGGNGPGREGNGPPSRKRPSQEEDENTTGTLACPFWKLNPVRHRQCFKSELSAINRVKQHLLRKHNPSFYCDRCKVIFRDQSGYDEHLSQPCILDPNAKLDGITHQQRIELSRRTNPLLSDSEQWFAIWNILFPHESRPSSAYLDSGLSEDISQYREYLRNRGPQVLIQELRRRGMALCMQEGFGGDGSGAIQEAALHEVMRSSLDMLFDDWQSSRPGEARGESRSTANTKSVPESKRRRRLPQAPTTCGSFTGSGTTLLSKGTRNLLPSAGGADYFSTPGVSAEQEFMYKGSEMQPFQTNAEQQDMHALPVTQPPSLVFGPDNFSHIFFEGVATSLKSDSRGQLEEESNSLEATEFLAVGGFSDADADAFFDLEESTFQTASQQD